jgi:hypothetical protein
MRFLYIFLVNMVTNCSDQYCVIKGKIKTLFWLPSSKYMVKILQFCLDLDKRF